MIGQLNPAHREVTVVGAGIAGMLAAYQLDRAGYTVTLLEASDRAGGLITTRETQWGIAEAAAHSIQATPAVRELCQELGVELVEVRPDSRARFIWRHGKLRKFPLKFGEALRTFLRAYFVWAKRDTDSESLTLEQWGRRFIGPAALKYLLTPFVRGIYGARPSELTVGAAFPSLVVPRGHSLLSWMFARSWRRRLARQPAPARGRMMAPAKGMGSLTQALELRLRAQLGARFRTGVPLSALPLDVPNLVICTPALACADLVAPEDPSLAQALRAVVYTPLVSVTTFAEAQAFANPPRGVGVLLPEGTQRKVLGVLFNSSSFPGRAKDEQQWASLTVMLGGSAHPELLQASDEELRQIIREDLKALLSMAPQARMETVIHRWSRAIPQYNGALQQAWALARQGFCSRPGRMLFGNYTGQVSIRGMIELAARLHSSVS